LEALPVAFLGHDKLGDTSCFQDPEGSLLIEIQMLMERGERDAGF
jgi:hypothetical protein